MKFYKNILESIGHTPLVQINNLVPKNQATILAKLEFFNPAGSIKDRMALHIIEKAEESGSLKKGSVIVEATSGNTGLGVAMTAAVKGYRCIFTIPDKMSSEKVNMLRAYGAEVIVTPTNVEHDSPESYYEQAKSIAKKTPNSFLLNQYYNSDNPEAHYLTTGPEIWEDTAGKIDVMIAGASTGGTVSGAGRYLKEQAKAAGRTIKILCPDPQGSIYADSFYKRPVEKPYVYKVEGIGNDVVVGCLDLTVIDEMRKVSDKDCFVMARKLAREEGLFVGGSSGAAAHVALQVAAEIGPGKVIVAIFPDSGSRYITKFYSDNWMKENKFLS